MLALTTRTPGRSVRTPGPDLDDLAGELVPEHRAGLEARSQAVEGEEVGAADRGRVDGDDRVLRLEDPRIGDVVDSDVAGRPKDDRLHGAASVPAEPAPPLSAGSVEPTPAGCSISTR